MRLAALAGLFIFAASLPAQASTATFRCALNVDLRASYSADGGRVTVQVQGRSFVLPQDRSGSGERYSDGQTLFWEHQGEALFQTPGLSLSNCKLVGPQ
ncbi:MAG: MliC family protein [Proteobacteria bacterium]|nr:MliC family protein [Pseudomonadota bacterium]